MQVSSEFVPYAKTGGLADVTGALSRIMVKKGINIISFLPFYKQIDKKTFIFENLKENLEIPEFKERFSLLKHHNEITNLTTYFIGNEKFFNRDEIYNAYPDNPERFTFFSKAVLKSLEIINFKPEIIHCHDWQTCAIPILIKNEIFKPDFFKNVKTLLTIHNLAFQGIEKKEILQKLGLDDSFFVPEKLEFYEKVNLLKGGIVYSDFINTVSETYAQEIQTDELSFGLKKELTSRKKDLFGILNGIDYEIWDPQVDKYIWKNYSYETLENKKYNKNQLRENLGLTLESVPLIGMVSRITSQKGFDLIIDIFDKLMNLELQLVILGKGQPEYHKIFKDFTEKYPKKFVLRHEFDDFLAHQIEAGSDIFLMPSQFEPCGLNQMISLKYGTIPIVHEIGGLADTIKDIRTNERGNGFMFTEYESEKLYETIKEALRVYKEKEIWKKIIQNAMECDFSWEKSAEKYLNLYKKLIKI
ncbi:MAG: glycogen synthase GlgA [Candidatus Hodarchaeota archaeon]